MLDLALRLGMEDEGFEEVDAYLTWAQVRARKLLQSRWHLVEALAAELLSRKVLSGTATRRLLRQADRQWADRQLEDAISELNG